MKRKVRSGSNNNSAPRLSNLNHKKTGLKIGICAALFLVAGVAVATFGPSSSAQQRRAAPTRPTPIPGFAPQDGISDTALAQMAALIQEKESRTPAQQKIDSQLLYKLKMFRGQS